MLQFQQHLFRMFFCKNDVMFHALWCHLLSLPCQFSIFEDVGGRQPRTLWTECEQCTFFTSSSFDVLYVPSEPTNNSICCMRLHKMVDVFLMTEWHGGELDRRLRAAKCLWTTVGLGVTLGQSVLFLLPFFSFSLHHMMSRRFT